MTNNFQKKLKQCFWIFIVAIFLSHPAHAQQVLSSVHIVVALQSGCIPTATVGCTGSITSYLYWNKSTGFPFGPPSSIGYWNGFVWRKSAVGGNPTSIASPQIYQGISHLQTVSAQFKTQDIRNLINSTYAAQYYAYSDFVDPLGMTTRIASAFPSPIAQEIGALAWAQEPTSEDLTLNLEHNLSCAGDPVYLHNGQYSYECTDLQIPGRKLDVDLRHAYLSGQAFNGPFGYGWFLNYYTRLHKLRNGDAVIIFGDGRKIRYTFSGGAYTSTNGRYELLTRNPNNTFTLTMAQGDRYQFDTEGRLAAIEDRNGNTISLNYGPTKQPRFGYSSFSQNPASKIQIGLDDQLASVTDTTGRVINFNYNSDGLLSSIVDGTRQVTYAYDQNTNDLLTITYPSTSQYPQGLVKKFTYDAQHNLKTITDPKNQTFVTNHYDGENRVSQQDLGSGSFQFDYSVLNRTTETDRNSNIVQYDFNSNGNMIRKEEFTRGLRGGDPASFVTTYTYNNNMEMTSITFPRGNGVKYLYDENNALARSHGNLLEFRRKANMSQPDNNTNDLLTTMTYETMFNQAKTLMDPRGNTTIFVYDYELPTNDARYAVKGNVIFIDQPTVTSGTPRTEFNYNSAGQITKTIDPNGIITNFAYFPSTGYLQTIARDPSDINAITQFTYDSFGYPDVTTDANGHITDLDFNELGWLIQEKNPAGNITHYTYDENGNLKTVLCEFQGGDVGIDSGQVTKFTYTTLNKLKTLQDPLNRLTTYNYDSSENRTSIVDAENRTTTYTYDERNLLFKTIDANAPQGTTQYDYDLNGNLKKITDANTHATDYAYDLFDRQQTITYADTKFTEFVYDKNSNLIQMTRGKPATPKAIDYIYDVLNRLTNKNFPQNTSLNMTYVYDLGSRVTSANTAAANNSFTYDNLSRLKTNTQTPASFSPLTISYDYDKVGNRSKITYPSGKVVDYTYDANDRMDLVNVAGNTIADYGWDALDRLQKKIFRNISPEQKVTFIFDIANQLKRVKNQFGGALISQFDYTQYDNVGNRKTLVDKRGTSPVKNFTYNYNNIYELTSVSGAQTHSFQYDNVANRTNVDGVVYTTNNVNQYTLIGAQAYSYDDNGNLSNDGVHSYTYDEENRLTQATGPGLLATYAYDALNRRVSKIVNGVATYFINDFDREIEERSSTGALIADYVYGNSMDEVLTMTRGGSTRYYQYDGLGSVIGLTNTNGATAESYEYDVYGQPNTVGSIGNPFFFTGRRFDPETGLYYYRARMYSPTIGRFLQRDPIDYYDSMNLYQFVLNNPVNYIDPFGLDTYRINNEFGKSDPTNSLLSHSFMAITDIDPTGKEKVIKTFSWVNTNGGMWEDPYKKQNIEGAQKAIDTGIGAWKKGNETLDKYMEEVFEEMKGQQGGFYGERGTCKMQASELLNEALKKKALKK